MALTGSETKGRISHRVAIEKYFINEYFVAKHYIHPFLDGASFGAQCLRLWSSEFSVTNARGFHTLYHAVVAVGAINSPLKDLPCLSDYYEDVNTKCRTSSSLQWAHWYFKMVKNAVGAQFETSSLELCQSMFLLVCKAVLICAPRIAEITDCIT